VGSYLSVHEGPQSISRRGMQELLPGMILSNEPGYYRDGAFGIRIENLVVVHEPQAIDGGDRPMLGFDTLTLCPIDKRLILSGSARPGGSGMAQQPTTPGCVKNCRRCFRATRRSNGWSGRAPRSEDFAFSR
jgi:hypothetical protein